jgi:hypothetical protein
VYKCATVSVNLGPAPLKTLPFAVRMVSNALQTDAVEAPKDNAGKPEAFVPVGLPNSGVLDWADACVAKHRGLVEVSGRAILNWLESSGLPLRKVGGSVERPMFQVVGAGGDQSFLGIAEGQAQRQVLQAAALQSKSVLVLEIMNSLRKDYRAELLATLGPGYLTNAVVVAGEPTKDIKDRAREVARRKKRAEFDRMVAARRVQKQRERAARQQKKKMERQREERIQQAKEQAAKLAAERKAAAAKKAAATAKNDGDAEDDESKAKPEEKVAEEEPAQTTKADPVVESEEEPEEPDPEFKDDTDYEKIKIMQRDMPDVAPAMLEHGYKDFSWPDGVEGFAKITHAWGDAKVAAKCLEDLVLERRKLEKRPVTPNKWFKDKVKEWNDALNEWKRLQKTKSTSDPASTEGGEPDIWSVEDVKDAGNGQPLFQSFQPEDWALLNLRFEMHALIHAFRQEVGEDHPGIHPDTFLHYYAAYFVRQFSFQMYGQESLDDLARLLADTLSADEESGCLLLGHPDETPLETFIKLTEEARRDRLARIEAGDETARLKMNLQLGKGVGKGWGGKAASHGSGATGLRSVPYRGSVLGKSFGKGR